MSASNGVPYRPPSNNDPQAPVSNLTPAEGFASYAAIQCSVVTSKIVTEPFLSVIKCLPDKTLNKVDLPAPLAPHRSSLDPRGTSRLMPRRIGAQPSKPNRKFSARRMN